MDSRPPLTRDPVATGRGFNPWFVVAVIHWVSVARLPGVLRVLGQMATLRPCSTDSLHHLAHGGADTTVSWRVASQPRGGGRADAPRVTAALDSDEIFIFLILEPIGSWYTYTKKM